ncbi:exonuclease domain-containing protein, partial [Glutamicibacter halophytocola]
MASNSEKIVWIDCEMTGLDLVNDALIEVAVLITDS